MPNRGLSTNARAGELHKYAAPNSQHIYCLYFAPLRENASRAKNVNANEKTFRAKYETCKRNN